MIFTNDKVRETFEAIAGEYDQKRKILIPCYEEFYTTPISLMPKFAGEIRALDIGAGTGLFTQFLLQQYPKARVTLVDMAEGMLDVAKSRFQGNNNVNYMTKDFTLCNFKEEFNVVISALSIHHLDNEDKQELFKKIYEWLQPGGMFINSDQVLGNTERLEYIYKRKWQEHIRLAGVSEKDIEAWKERLKIDQETTVEQQINWLRETGFVDVDCVYKYYKFAVLVGFKPANSIWQERKSQQS